MVDGRIDGHIIFDTLIDTSGVVDAKKVIEKAVSSLSNSFKKIGQIDTSGVVNAQKVIEKSTTTLGNAFKKLGKLALTAFSVKAIINFSKQALEAASDLQEVQNVVDVAFGSMSDAVNKWAKTTVEKFGMSELKAKQFASTYAAMGKGMGLDNDKSAAMAIGATERIGDIASFYNKSFEEVDAMMKSIWTGETESLKRIGVVMTETNLKAFALSQGITQNYKDMDQATKTQLRYAYVMQQTALAQGDFIRTSDSWANQTRILSEQFNTLKISIGTGLIQALTPALKYINLLMTKINQLAAKFSEFTAYLFGKQSLGGAASETAAATEDISSGIYGAADAEKALGNEIDKTTKKQQKQLMGFDQLNRLGSDDNAGGAAGSAGGVGGVGSLGDIKFDEGPIDKSLDNIGTKFDKLKEKVKGLFSENDISGLKRNFENSLAIAKHIWSDIKNLGSPLMSWVNEDVTTNLKAKFSGILAIINGLWSDINLIVVSLWDVIIYPVINDIVTYLLPVLTQIDTACTVTLTHAFKAINNVFQTVWVGGVLPVLERVKMVFHDMCVSISNFWKQYGKPIFDGLNKAIETTRGALFSIWNKTIKPLVDYVLKAVDEIWKEHLKPFVDEVLSLAGEVILCVENVYNYIAPYFAAVVNWISDKLMPIIKGAVNSVKISINTVIDIFKNIVTVVKGVFKIISGIFSGDTKKIMSGFKDIISGTLNSIKALFTGIINKIINAVETGVNGAIKAINTLANPLRTIKEATNIGFTIPVIKEVKLPRLASGTVIPANYGEFAAILGDNKRETEVVSPLSTMKQALAEVLKEMNLEANINLIIEMDGDKLTYKIVKQHNNIVARTGRTPLKGVNK